VNEVPLEHGRELAKGAVRELDGRVKQLVLDHAFGRLVDEAVRTNALTEAGEKKLLAIGEAMGITLDRLESDSGLANLKAKVTIGRVNDGRLPVIDDPKILLRKGEVAHIAIDAELMKHITLREYQGGHSGFSFRVMKGVRYYIGGSKGESVVVGEDIQRVDGGVLTITSERVVFAGQRRSLEIPYGKLIGMDVWENGIRFNSSARTNVAMFTLFSGDMVAAIVNAAMQNMGEDGDKRVQTSTPRIASMGSSNPQH
jgi:hypothetical protein